MSFKKKKEEFDSIVLKGDREMERALTSTNFQARGTILRGAIKIFTRALDCVPGESQKSKTYIKMACCFENLALTAISENKDPREDIFEAYAYFDMAKSFDDTRSRITSLGLILHWVVERMDEKPREISEFFARLLKSCTISAIRELMLKFMVNILESASVDTGIFICAALTGKDVLIDSEISHVLKWKMLFGFRKEYSSAVENLGMTGQYALNSLKSQEAIEILSDMKNKWKSDCPCDTLMAEIHLKLVECYCHLHNFEKANVMGIELQKLVPEDHELQLKLKFMLSEGKRKETESNKRRVQGIESAFRENMECGVRSVLKEFKVADTDRYYELMWQFRHNSDSLGRTKLQSKLLLLVVSKITHPDISSNIGRGSAYTEFCTSVTQVVNSIRQRN